jgi:PAS domain-containing protein
MSSLREKYHWRTCRGRCSDFIAPRGYEWLLAELPTQSHMLLAAYGGRIMSVSPARMRWVLPVDPVDQPRSQTSPGRIPKREWRIASLALMVSSAVLVVAVLVANLQSPRVALALLISLMAAMLIFALVSADIIRQMRRREHQVRSVFEDREQEFRQMADNIQEVFWVIDPEMRTATYVNPAYEAITGRSCQSLIEEPSSYEKAIHPCGIARIPQAG